MSLTSIHSLDYTVLLCRNLAGTRDFYRDVMAFPLVYDHERWVEFRVGGAILALRRRGQAPWGDDGPLKEGSAAVQLAFRVPPAAVDECHAELVAAGVPILRGPTDLTSPWHHRTLFFSDPEGNVIEIYAEI